MVLSDILKAFKYIKNSFPGYEERTQQITMAEEVCKCLKNGQNMLIEAGTGVGKTFAYLIPAVLSRQKTIISTATIALQEQLIKKDLAFLVNALPVRFSYSILKGKGNYLCIKRTRGYSELGNDFKMFMDWADKTKTGDKDELHFLPPFWHKVCGDSEDCGGGSCPDYRDCFYYRHYRELYKNDILVVNHHLLAFDLLSEFNLLPFHKQLIIDEAHNIEEVISHVLGSSITLSRFTWLINRMAALGIVREDLLKEANTFFYTDEENPGPVSPIPEYRIEGLKRLEGLLEPYKQIKTLKILKGKTTDERMRDRVDTVISSIESLSGDLKGFIDQPDGNSVYFMRINRGTLEMKSSLVDAGPAFERLTGAYKSLIITSATLSINGSFAFVKNRLALDSFRDVLIGSPFNYRTQALLYIDNKLPPPVKPNSEVFKQESLKVIEDLINASGGRALVLFTSYSHLNFVSKSMKIKYPIKAQGDMPSARLIEWFKDTPHSVLLATATFWQGIDIKGSGLSQVIITKMPFGSPGDPVYDERCRRLGDRWFQELALPSAILLLRQGFGRLIRAIDDTGVVSILDTRLITSSYGRTITTSLPDVDIVHGIDDVKRFFTPKSRYSVGIWKNHISQ